MLSTNNHRISLSGEGLGHYPEWTTWHDMIQRCYDKQQRNYKNYGRKGITVCGRWLQSFGDFLSDMGLKPGKNYVIDRIDNGGDYEPCNCRWITKRESARQGPRKLSNDDVRAIRKLYKDGYIQRRIARRFGVTQSAISLVVSGERWGDIC